MISFDDLPIYVIVVEDSPTSQWYFDRILPSWHQHGFDPVRFPASTPQSIEQRTELKFSSYVHMYKYVKQGIRKPFAPTEKACWYSHFDAWKKCIELDTPIAVIEHDALLVYPENLIVRADLSFFDASAMGGYVINPKAAKCLVDVVTSNGDLFSPPFSSIVWYMSVENPKRAQQINFSSWHTKPWRKDPMYATKQIYNHLLGRTIDRYGGVPLDIAVYEERKAQLSSQMVHVQEDVSEWMAAHGYPPAKNFSGNSR